MSTRANIIIRDGHDELIFYRHCDGYPEGILPSLNRFLDIVQRGKIRDNTGQAAGWLVLLGAIEYQTLPQGSFPEGHKSASNLDTTRVNSVLDNLGNDIEWGCGAYEPTTEIHGDIAYLYVIDLRTKRIHIDGQDGFEYEGAFSNEKHTAYVWTDNHRERILEKFESSTPITLARVVEYCEKTGDFDWERDTVELFEDVEAINLD